jgi:hypothetical protein
MQRLVIVIALLLAVGVGVGFYRGWFSVASESNGGHSNVTLTVDKAKFEQDEKAALEKVRPSGPSTQSEVPTEAR